MASINLLIAHSFPLFPCSLAPSARPPAAATVSGRQWHTPPPPCRGTPVGAGGIQPSPFHPPPHLHQPPPSLYRQPPLRLPAHVARDHLVHGLHGGQRPILLH